jgi:hypothetical protein
MLSNKTVRSAKTSRSLRDLFAKKHHLVKLERDLIDRVQLEWQDILYRSNTNLPGAQLSQRATAETSIKACYQYAGLDAPNIVWIDWPVNAIKFLLTRPDLVDVSGQIVHEIWLSEQAIQQVIDPAAALEVLSRIKTTIVRSPNTAIADRLNELAIDRVKNCYGDLADLTIFNPLQNYSIGNLGYFDYFLQIGVNIPQMQPIIDLAKSCGWCWAFEKLAILTPKPARVISDGQGNILAMIIDGSNVLE